MTQTTQTREWSTQQQAIFSWFARGVGNLVVRARAGTGKTTTIIEGVGHAPEREILLAAFNKRIADELQARLHRGDAKTLHSVGFSFVRRQWSNVRVDNDRGMRLAKEVLGEDARYADVRLVKDIASKGKGISPEGGVRRLMELAVQFDLLPEGLERHGGESEDEEEELSKREAASLERLCEAANDAMALAAEPDKEGPGTLDFDDMCFVPVRNGWLRPRYDVVVIDEGQDMNPVQLTIALGVVKKDGRVAVVGDDCQSIYSFRGADSGALDRLKGELNAQELGLTVTYRCPQQVVAIAQEFVPDFVAAPTAPEGIIRDIVDTQLVKDVQAGDFVLSRKNAPLVAHCLACLRAGKCARIEGRDIAKGILNLIKKLKSRDLEGLTVKLCEWEAREVARAVRTLGEDGAAAKVGQIMDMKETILALMADAKTVRELEEIVEKLFADGGEGVVFSSVHKAKGMESERVFLLEETFMHDSGRREEQNIRYVAVTRSKNELIFVEPSPEGA